jgi:hypothetical protein
VLAGGYALAAYEHARLYQFDLFCKNPLRGPAEGPVAIVTRSLGPVCCFASCLRSRLAWDGTHFGVGLRGRSAMAESNAHAQNPSAREITPTNGILIRRGALARRTLSWHLRIAGQSYRSGQYCTNCGHSVGAVAALYTVTTTFPAG